MSKKLVPYSEAKPVLESAKIDLSVAYYMKTLDTDYFDAAQALYWYAANYHGGQSSTLYSLLSRLNYKPGAMETGPDKDLDGGMSMSEMIYEDLKAGSLDPEELLDWIEDEYRKRRV
jgi:hypothetical protein